MKRKEITISRLSNTNHSLREELKAAKAKIRSLQSALERSQTNMKKLTDSVNIKKRLLCNPDAMSMDRTSLAEEIRKLVVLFGKHLIKEGQLELLMNETLTVYNRKNIPKKWHMQRFERYSLLGKLVRCFPTLSFIVFFAQCLYSDSCV